MRSSQLRFMAAVAAVALSLSPALPGEPAMAANISCAAKFPPVAPDYHEESLTYLIQSAANLIWLSVNQNEAAPNEAGKKWRELDFSQIETIDLEHCLFTPIGTQGSGITPQNDPFKGEYTAYGAAIHNLKIAINDNPNDEPEPAGLFGVTEAATIRGVAIVNSQITGGLRETGALIGRAKNSLVIDVTVAGQVSGTGPYVGGLIGVMSSGDVYRSSANVSLQGGSTGGTGGLIGIISAGALIDESFASGSVQGHPGLAENVGGLVGSMANSDIVNSYSTSAVRGEIAVGGLVGEVSGVSKIANSFATGRVRDSGSNVGGLVGSATNSVTITNSFWDTDTTEQTSSAGGTGKSTAAMKSIGTFTSADPSWDIVDTWSALNPAGGSDIWGIGDGNNGGYPFLLWEITPPNCFDAVWMKKPILDPELKDRYLIENPGNLVYLSAVYSDATYGSNTGDVPRDAFFEQTAAVDLQGCLFAPIGKVDPTSDTIDEAGNLPFIGAYDGLDNEIRGVRAFRAGSDAGLFGATYGANLTRINLVNVEIESPNSRFVGGLVGLAVDTDISETSVSGVVRGDVAGGVIGAAEGVLLEGVSSQVDVTASMIAGGLIGLGQDLLLDDSHAAGQLSLNLLSPGPELAGGLVGWADGITVADSSADISVLSSGAESVMGGLVGVAQSVDVSRSFANAHIQAPLGGAAGGLIAGGLIGAGFGAVNQNVARISESYAMGTVQISGGSAGGLVGVADYMQIEDSYSDVAVQSNGPNAVAGGLIGAASTTAVYRSLAIGTTQGSGTSVGGLIGSASGSSAISSFWKVAEVTTFAVGAGKTESQLKSIATYTTELPEDDRWSIASCSEGAAPTWGIAADGSEYPFLIWSDPNRLSSCQSSAPPPQSSAPPLQNNPPQDNAPPTETVVSTPIQTPTDGGTTAPDVVDTPPPAVDESISVAPGEVSAALEEAQPAPSGPTLAAGSEPVPSDSQSAEPAGAETDTAAIGADSGHEPETDAAAPQAGAVAVSASPSTETDIGLAWVLGIGAAAVALLALGGVAFTRLRP